MKIPRHAITSYSVTTAISACLVGAISLKSDLVRVPLMALAFAIFGGFVFWMREREKARLAAKVADLNHNVRNPLQAIVYATEWPGISKKRFQELAGDAARRILTALVEFTSESRPYLECKAEAASQKVSNRQSGKRQSAAA